ncbi:methyl-accepting chemotaxis protein [Leptothrix discophora]|uniref:Methyl-accepting chemotaxis protein n=1 Tax=Leptothrix discophora TaxID=89 RepID=A0ABT9G0N7_LEPDI|nr:methyl-accepting chemotaxis protein [Leptothrix discophora]MDP4300044.1 methyl-accepting chemotaxis protein [Leptothrix discophora]
MPTIAPSFLQRLTLNVAHRLALGFAALLLAIVGVGGVALYQLDRLQRESEAAEARLASRLELTLTLQSGIDRVALHARNLALAEDTLARTQEARLLNQALARVDALERRLRTLDWDGASLGLLDGWSAAAGTVRPRLDALTRAGRAASPAGADGLPAALAQLRPVEAAWQEQTQVLIDHVGAQAQAAATARRVEHPQVREQLATLLIVCLLAGGCMAWMLVRPLGQVLGVREMREMRQPARTDRRGAQAMPAQPERAAPTDAAAIDLTQPAAPATPAVSPAPTAPEPPMPAPVEVMQELLQRVQSNPAQPVSPAREAATALGAADAAPAVLADPDRLVANAVQVAERGSEVVTQVVSNMEDISASSQKINEILATIDGIAFQTNLLALNAAVQAARAGHDGHGSHGAVAGEVRGLAQRAASAAREIKGLINASLDKAEAGGRLVRDAGATMDAIVSSVQSVTELVGQIGNQAESQTPETLQQADRSVRHLDQLTRQNAALVEQSASAADALRDQAERLQKVVAAFRLLQQTQEAAWTAHTAIHSARTTSRGDTLPGGLDDLPPAARPRGKDGEPPAGGDWKNF